jgi:hypothetical protein
MQLLRQRLVNHAQYWRARYELLTRVLKPMTTALWQSRGNRAATARGSKSMIRKNGYRFSEKITLNQMLERQSIPV